ncbi:MAG: hypothetical protein KDD82_13285 [Planctomycetes bacterium]|nr:hypothetical protein [Planctomycetota bacterium]
MQSMNNSDLLDFDFDSDERTWADFGASLASLPGPELKLLLEAVARAWEVEVGDLGELQIEFSLRRMQAYLRRVSREDLARPATLGEVEAWEREHQPLPRVLKRFLVEITAGRNDHDEWRPFCFSDRGAQHGRDWFEPFFQTLEELLNSTPLLDDRLDPPLPEVTARLGIALATAGTGGESISLAKVEEGSPLNLGRFLVLEHYVEGNHADDLTFLSLDGAPEVFVWDSPIHDWPGRIRRGASLLDFLDYVVYD